jgi:phosphohistidine phosphatase SixA
MRCLVSRSFGLALVALAFTCGPAAANDVGVLWGKLREGGRVALIRHAQAPGGAGDPAGFMLGHCMTQRNLSAQGRDEARKLGDSFRAQQVPVGKLLSSQWCRCRETAALMKVGEIEDAPTFNNAYVLSDQRAALTEGARAVIAAWKGPGTLVVVTHGANIAPLTGFNPAEAEIVVVEPRGAAGKPQVLGRIPFGS